MNYDPFTWKTSIGQNGHLAWDWLETKHFGSIFTFISLAFYVLPLFFIKNSILLLFMVISIPLSLIFYHNHTFGSMWCWSANILFLYFIINILLIQPFMEYNGKLC